MSVWSNFGSCAALFGDTIGFGRVNLGIATYNPGSKVQRLDVNYYLIYSQSCYSLHFSSSFEQQFLGFVYLSGQKR